MYYFIWTKRILNLSVLYSFTLWRNRECGNFALFSFHLPWRGVFFFYVIILSVWIFHLKWSREKEVSPGFLGRGAEGNVLMPLRSAGGLFSSTRAVCCTPAARLERIIKSAWHVWRPWQLGNACLGCSSGCVTFDGRRPFKKDPLKN